MYEVTSEIYAETDFEQTKSQSGKIISKFKFYYPKDQLNASSNVATDEDGDLMVQRRKDDVIEIEHANSTTIEYVGLQVWRGAFLLADFLFHKRNEFKNKKILELGAGVGLTSIAAGIYMNYVLCTDVDIGGILNLIRSNIKRNHKLFKHNQIIDVDEVNFKNFNLSTNPKLKEKLQDIEIILAADVIYDDDLTDSFIDVVDKLLMENFRNKKTLYMALEKRYVFTLDDLETVAPCYYYFQKKITGKMWNVSEIPIHFPQYFQYERCKELVLLEITKKC